MKNYSKICVEILGKTHDLLLYTNTEEFVFNEDGDYFEDDELGKMDIPDEEIVVMNKLIDSGFLNSEKFKNGVSGYINECRKNIGMDKLELGDLWSDLQIKKIVTRKEEDNSEIKIFLLGEIEETDPEHGISIVFLDNEVIEMGGEMDYEAM